MSLIQGFDDRSWNGFLTPEQAKLWAFVGIKVSQGRNWNPSDRATLQRQWQRAKENYNLMRLPFHYWLPGVLGQNGKQYGEFQADNFRDSMNKWNNPAVLGYGELPPCIDVESRFVGMASAKSRALNLKACLDQTEVRWSRVPIIYTATWYWDSLMHPEFVKLVPEYWLKYDLWEADPLPNTKIAGWGDDNSIQQYKLGIDLPNYGSGDIDLNETTQEWVSSVYNPIPIPDNCDEEISEALEKQKQELEGECLVQVGLATKLAYNSGIADAKEAVTKLFKD